MIFWFGQYYWGEDVYVLYNADQVYNRFSAVDILANINSSGLY